MNFAPQSPWTYGEEADHRSDHEKLKDALDRHLQNAGLLKSIHKGPTTEEISLRAQRAYDDSQAELYTLVEDLTCVSAARLREGLSA